MKYAVVWFKIGEDRITRVDHVDGRVWQPFRVNCELHEFEWSTLQECGFKHIPFTDDWRDLSVAYCRREWWLFNTARFAWIALTQSARCKFWQFARARDWVDIPCSQVPRWRDLKIFGGSRKS